MADCSRNEDFNGSQDIQGASMTKKYGGLEPKKKPLISKDHERAFFDSADWALCKQGAGVDQTATVAIETLRPKLQWGNLRFSPKRWNEKENTSPYTPAQETSLYIW